MTKRIVSGGNGTQEMFELGERLSISREYDPAEAAAMARHRAERIGGLALTPAAMGFRRLTSGLWVPHSAMENTAVTTNPETFMHRTGELVKEKVIEKFLGDDSEHEVPEARVALWAQFADDMRQRELANRFNTWRLDGREKAARMNAGFTSFDGFVDRALVESEAGAPIMGSIAAYLADLKSYIGHPDMKKGVKRVWMQDRWTKRQAEHLEWTKNMLWTEPDWDFERWFAESYYNHRSRAKFWYGVISKSAQMRADIVAQKLIKEYREDMIRRGFDLDPDPKRRRLAKDDQAKQAS
jgi:hypothetical protein